MDFNKLAVCRMLRAVLPSPRNSHSLSPAEVQGGHAGRGTFLPTSVLTQIAFVLLDVGQSLWCEIQVEDVGLDPFGLEDAN